MATCRSSIKCLKKTCEIVSYCIWWLQFCTCTRNKGLYKRGFLKNFSKLSDKHKEQSSGGVQSKDPLKNFVKFTEKHLSGVSFLTKLQVGNFKQVVLKNVASFALEKISIGDSF